MKEKIIYKGFVEKNNDLGFLFCVFLGGVSDFLAKKIYMQDTQKNYSEIKQRIQNNKQGNKRGGLKNTDSSFMIEEKLIMVYI